MRYINLRFTLLYLLYFTSCLRYIESLTWQSGRGELVFMLAARRKEAT